MRTHFSEESSSADRGQGALAFPKDAAVFEDGGLCEMDGHRIVCFRADGTFEHDFQTGHVSGTTNPWTAMCVRPGADTVYVAADYGEDRIGVHQRDGTLIRSFGKCARGPGILGIGLYFGGIAVSRDGEVFFGDC